MQNRFVGFAALLATATVGACSDSGAPSTDAQVQFDVAIQPATASMSTGGPSYAITATPETFTDGAGNVLVLQQVQLVLRQIELKKATVSTTCQLASNADDCAEMQLGPRILDLPLGTAGAQRTFAAEIPPGTYGEIEFEVHKPEGSNDSAFVAANPDFNGVSIRVTGTYNGTPFTFTSDLDVEMELELAPPLVVAASGSTDLTLFVNLDGWFRSGGNLIDPATANKGQPNEGTVKENIKSSLEAFEDRDRDGVED